MSRVRALMVSLFVLTLVFAVTACTQAATPQTITLKETVTVRETVTIKETVTVKETVVVEKQVQVPITPTPAPARAKTLTYILAQEPISMDPAVATESQSGLAIRNVYERLVELGADGQTILPGLAESWERSADGLTYTFKLRRGATFHSGAPVNAEAARYSLERLLALGKGNSILIKDYIDPKNVKAVDDTTLTIKLNEPYAPIVSILAFWNVGSVVNPAFVKANATADDPWANKYLTDHMDGSGPFKFVEWQRKQFVAVERNPRYWRGPAKLDRIIFRLVEEPATKRLMLEKGEVDILHNLPTDMVEALRQNADVTIVQKPGLETTYWAFNHEQKPFNDPRVRQAIALAIDYDALMTGIVKQGGVRMRGPLPRGIPGYDESVTMVRRDIARAKTLLAEAGYPNGLTTVMHYPVWRDLPSVAVVMQANLAEIGVKVDLKEITLNNLVELVVSGTTPFFPWVSTPAYADPDAVLYPKFHTKAIKAGAAGNIARFSSADVDKMLDEARSSANNAKRLQTYQDVQHKVTNDAAWIYLFQSVNIQPVRKWVQGFDIATIGVPDFWGVDVAK